MLAVGDKAPPFSLASTSGAQAALADYAGKRLVLYFYPKDQTPGCTQQACDFRDSLARITATGTAVLGVSKDSLGSHERFRQKHGLPFELLSDPDSALAAAYGAYGEKTMYGRTVQGTIRSTFLVDETGRIAAVWSPVKVAGHVDEVLAALQGAPKKKVAKKKVSKK